MNRDEGINQSANPDERQTQLDAAAAALAEVLYNCTAANKVAGRKWLMKQFPQAPAREAVQALTEGIDRGEPHQALRAIDTLTGSKDSYYYDGSIMTREFAQLDALIQDKDILKTIASVTRSDCQLYPRPTEFSKLTGYPFRFTIDEVEGAAARMATRDEYSDIGVVQASNGEKAFYSSRYLKEAYARSLLESSEVESKLWP